MTEQRLLDYSYARPSMAAIKGSGAVGVMRYLAHSTGKCLSAAEAKQLRAAGLQVGLVFEDTAQRAKAGRAAGKADALFATEKAKAVGAPLTCPIFYAVDFDAHPADVLDYFRGVADAKTGHPVGVYGSAQVVDGVLLAHLAAYGWQTVAWSRGVRSARAHLLQRVTATHKVAGTDENVLLKPMPLWGAPAAPKPVAPAPAPAKPAAKAPAPAPKVPAKVPPKVAPKPAPAPVPAHPADCGGLTPVQVHKLRAHRNWWAVIMHWLGKR